MTVLDMHIHLKQRSACSNLSLEDIYNNISQNLGGICITDHGIFRPIKPNPFQNMRIFIGMEITCEFGDILAYGIKSEPTKNMKASKVIEFIHNQGGVAVCAHPFSNKGHESFEDDVFEFNFDAIEINGSLTRKYNDMAKKAAKIIGIPTIGGSDAHSISQLNTMGTKFSTRITSIENIVKAIKNNKCKAVRI